MTAPEPPRGKGAGRSAYSGLRLTVTQAPGDDVMWLSVTVKRPADGWDAYSLLFPAQRVPVRRLDGYRDVLSVVAEVAEHLLESEG